MFCTYLTYLCTYNAHTNFFVNMSFAKKVLLFVFVSPLFIKGHAIMLKSHLLVTELEASTIRSSMNVIVNSAVCMYLFAFKVFNVITRGPN